jgi:hypothetical protein
LLCLLSYENRTDSSKASSLFGDDFAFSPKLLMRPFWSDREDGHTACHCPKPAPDSCQRLTMRVAGCATPHADGGRFHAGFMLHDPYASRVVPVLLPETAYTNAPKLPPTYDVKVPVMLSSLAGFTQVVE